MKKKKINKTKENDIIKKIELFNIVYWLLSIGGNLFFSQDNAFVNGSISYVHHTFNISCMCFLFWCLVTVFFFFN